ncbi:hypothetical protein FBZ96_105698 [Bradyrhizobium stylosanthis]|uniref:Uncharacterized protein n=1 Tax=Bradyrhizobium stylosanthis TaxID=1803665 RepID=A0A560DPI8_9BRAD|nr:hypothetical protein FBZ96_105698 [Bradyrhizobium stylosanthis]
MLFEFVSNRAEPEGNTKLPQHRIHHAHSMTDSESLEIWTYRVQSKFSYQQIDLVDLDEPAQCADMSRHATIIVANYAQLRSRTSPASITFKGYCVKSPGPPVGPLKELRDFDVV